MQKSALKMMLETNNIKAENCELQRRLTNVSEALAAHEKRLAGKASKDTDLEVQYKQLQLKCQRQAAGC